MYAVTVTRTFVAQHVLTVPDPGPEGEPHSHRYGLEVTVRGPALDEYGYLLDIDDLRAAADGTVARYRDEMLNDLPEFAGKNPSAERLARAIGDRVTEAIDLGPVETVAVTLWEDDDAGVSFERRP